MALVGAAGCETFQGAASPQWMAKRWLDSPTPQVSEVLAYWRSEVYFSQDEENQKKPLPGLAGRVMFASQSSNRMVEATGELVVRLYDMTNVAAPRLLAEYGFDPHALKKLKSEDRFGDGYTLFLPWETYRPEVRQVQVELRYFPKDGSEIRAQPTTLVLETNAAPRPHLHVENFTTAPTAANR